jgi:hypothetical protein
MLDHPAWRKPLRGCRGDKLTELRYNESADSRIKLGFAALNPNLQDKNPTGREDP